MWTDGKIAAVSITYDDSHPTQLDTAIPELENRGFRGTFFITPGIAGVSARAADWRRASENGHEIANHTWSHPCNNLPYFTAEQFAMEETGKAEQWLNDNIGYDELRTYAYICAETKLGAEPGAHERYLDLVRKTFWAARVGGGGPTSRAEALAEPHLIAAQATTYGNNDAALSIQYCEQAALSGGWAVLVFHQIIPSPAMIATDTSIEVHSEILDHLVANKERFWVAPFRDVYRYILESA
jgi:peptidoglycan/xylan/chitin deacetylase (PgdA/CDA1 family)